MKPNNARNQDEPQNGLPNGIHGVPRTCKTEPRENARLEAKRLSVAGSSCMVARDGKGEGPEGGRNETVADGEHGLTMPQILVPAVECPRAHTAHN